MFIHVVHKLNWPILTVISVFALPLGGAEFIKLTTERILHGFRNILHCPMKEEEQTP